MMMTKPGHGYWGYPFGGILAIRIVIFCWAQGGGGGGGGWGGGEIVFFFFFLQGLVVRTNIPGIGLHLTESLRHGKVNQMRQEAAAAAAAVSSESSTPFSRPQCSDAQRNCRTQITSVVRHDLSALGTC